MTASLQCRNCETEQPVLARFCRHCRSDLTQSAAPARPVQLKECWSQNSPDTVEFVLASHSLVAAARSGGRVDLFALRDGQPLTHLEFSQTLESAALLDNLLVGVWSNRVEVAHLTPRLTGDPCRYDRGRRSEVSGPLASPLTASGLHVVWKAGRELVCWVARPQGLEPLWRRPLERDCLGLCLHEEEVLFLWEWGVQRFALADGQPTGTHELNFRPVALRCQGDSLWVAGDGGELWRHQRGLWQPAWPAVGRGYSFAVDAGHALVSAGRKLHVLNLESGRRHSLELPQPCVLAPLLSQSTALLASYEGMLYQLDLDQEQPRVVLARRPFTSFEPTTVQPLLVGDRLVLAGPEGQVAVWSL